MCVCVCVYLYSQLCTLNLHINVCQLALHKTGGETVKKIFTAPIAISIIFLLSFLTLSTHPLLPLLQSFTFVYAQSRNPTTSKFPTSFWESLILVLRPSSSFVPTQKTAWQNLQLLSNLERNKIKISMFPTVLFLTSNT